MKETVQMMKDAPFERRFYTLESYAKKSISTFEVPKEVYHYNWGQILFMHAANDARILNLTEIFFLILFTHQELEVYTLPLSKSSYLDACKVAALYEMGYTIATDALYGEGCPDFLLLSKCEKRCFKFVEVKPPNGQLSDSQIRWFEKYPYDIEIAYISN